MCFAASCCVLLCVAVVCGGSTVPPVGRGVASALVRLVALLCATLRLCGWLVAGGRGSVWCGLLGLYFGGLGVRSVWWVRRVSPGLPLSRVLWGSLSLGVLWGGVGWSPRLCWVPSHPVPLPPCCPPSLVSRPCPLPPLASVPLRPCGGPCCCQGHRLAVRLRWWIVRCYQRPPVWGYPPPPVWVYPPSPVRGLVVGGRDLVWFVRCQVSAAAAHFGGRASALCLGAAVSLGGLAVLTGWGLGVRCGVPLLRGAPPGARHGALSPSAMAAGLSFSSCWWSTGASLPPCSVAPGVLSLWVPACYLGHLLALLPRAFPLPCPFPVCWWSSGAEVCRAPMAHALRWVVSSQRRRVSGVQGWQRPLTASRRRASDALCGIVASGAGLAGSAGMRVKISSKALEE